MVDAGTGQVVSTRRTWPFGETRSQAGSSPTDHGFTGQVEDSSTGLYYYGARYYSSSLGRFVQPDTACNTRVNDTYSCLALAVVNTRQPDLHAFNSWTRGVAGTHGDVVPLDPQLLNRYAYAANNPTTLIDPNGHSPLSPRGMNDWEVRGGGGGGGGGWGGRGGGGGLGGGLAGGWSGKGSGGAGGGRAAQPPPVTRGQALGQLDETTMSAGQRSVARGRDFEARVGSRQTRATVEYQGETRTVILDDPPTGSIVPEYKNYDWANPAYDKPFIQDRVVVSFEEQISVYRATGNNVNFVFSEEPPRWLVEAIARTGATYTVAGVPDDPP